MTHPFMLAMICSKYGKKPSRTVGAIERTWQNVPCFRVFIEKSWLNYFEDISRSNVIMCDTPSHASDHVCLTWQESIQNCRLYRADTTCGTDGWTWWNQYTSNNFVVRGIIMASCKEFCKWQQRWTFTRFLFRFYFQWRSNPGNKHLLELDLAHQRLVTAVD